MTFTELGGRVCLTESSKESHLYTVQNIKGVPGKHGEETGGSGYCKHLCQILILILVIGLYRFYMFLCCPQLHSCKPLSNPVQSVINYTFNTKEINIQFGQNILCAAKNQSFLKTKITLNSLDNQSSHLLVSCMYIFY